MTVIHRVISQVDVSEIPTQSIGFQQLKVLVATGVSTIPPTLKYITFATAFGTRPEVTIDYAGTIKGSGSISSDVVRIRPGSFQWVGTPSVRARWLAEGL